MSVDLQIEDNVKNKIINGSTLAPVAYIIEVTYKEKILSEKSIIILFIQFYMIII